jgi:hypothetical protein
LTTEEDVEGYIYQAVNEDSDYTKQIAYYKHNYPSIYDLTFLQQMLAHTKELMEYQNGYVPINEKQ